MKVQIKLQLLFISTLLVLTMMVATQPVSGYTPCVGAERGDTVNMHYEGHENSKEGPIFDTSYGGEPFVTVLSPDNLIQGFYEGVIGMKIGDRKWIEVPPSKGYTQEGHKLYGKYLYFDVVLNDVTEGFSSECDTPSGNFGAILLKVFGWIGGILVFGFLGVSGYLQLQKTSTPPCLHCKNKDIKTISEGKCGKCGSTYCRKSFARGCPNCGSNTFVPHKTRLD